MRDLDGFDFAARPSLDPGQICELAACRWVAHGDALLLLEPAGVDKSHLAIALGREAIREGYSVLFVAAPALVAALAKALFFGGRLAFYAKPKLVIAELGYLPFEPNAARLFFQPVSRRYERGSLPITSTAPSAIEHRVRRPRRRPHRPRPAAHTATSAPSAA